MRIRTVLMITLAAAVLLMLTLGVSSWRLSQQLSDAITEEMLASRTSREITQLLVLTHEYALHGEERAAQQWTQRLASLTEGMTAGPSGTSSPRIAEFSEETVQRLATLSELFKQLQATSQAPETPLQSRRKGLLLDQMLTNVSLLSEAVEAWHDEVSAEHRDLHHQLQQLDKGTPFAMLLLLVALSTILARKVLQPLAHLQTAVRAVAQGNLAARTGSTAKDELGELSRTFDAMAVDLVRDLRQQVSERQAAENLARQKASHYALLSHCNHAIVHSRSADELFQKVCSAAVTLGGLKMAWIGMVDTATRAVRPVASHGNASGYLTDIRISVDPESPFSQGPTGTAIRDDQPFWCLDFLTNPRTAPWHAAGTQAGWLALAALPLHRNGKVVGALNLYAGDAHAFDDDLRQLLMELATDISFALDIFDHETERKRVAAALQETETMFSLLLHQTPIYVFIKEVSATESRVLRVSDNFIEMVGIASADMVGKTMEELFPPELAEKFTADDWAVVSKGEVLTLEESLNGRTYSTIKFPIVQAGKSFVAGYTIDITESKRAEARLTEQLDELRRWQQVMLGREERILAMKQEVNALLAEQGRPARYQSAQDEGQEAAR
jgi:PAS domain S-box-containing protein